MEWQLTDKAIFPESDFDAARNVCFALGITMSFLDEIVLNLNQDPEALNLWEIAQGLQSSAEIYYASGGK